MQVDAMKTYRIRIGKSREIRPPRVDWAEAFRSMAEHSDDLLLDRDSPHPTPFDDSEWEW